MPPYPIFLLFFLSGAAGLIFEIIWIRQFGNTFGNTIYSAALVTAVFMSGLGIGSYLAGILADRRVRRDPRDLLRLYGYFELAIAALGMAVALGLPGLESLSASISRYVTDERGWQELSLGSHLWRYLICLVMLLPITTLMGGTLTILIRFLLARNLGRAGWQIGLLFGINTGGAALGCFLVDFSLIPRFGLLASQGIAAGLNLTAAAGALALATRVRPAAPVDAPAPEPDPERAGRLVVLTALAIFVSGFAAMGMEILWIRFLSSVLGGLRSVLSLVLAVMLSGMWLGSMAAGVVSRRIGRPRQVYAVAQGAFVFASLGLLIAYDPALKSMAELRSAVGPDTGEVRRTLLELWFQLRVILLVVGPPSVLMGFAYPTANAHLQRRHEGVGRRAGILYLANNVGAVLGSLATGFFLLPWLGSQRSAFLLAVLAAAAIPLILGSSPRVAREAPGRAWRLLRLAGAVGIPLWLGFWLLLPPNFLAAKAFTERERRATFLAISEGITETVAVVKARSSQDRVLYTNGHLMSGTPFKAQRYMRAFVHLPMLHLDRPEDVLIICFGIGNTAHAASLYESVERIDVVDLSRNVLEHARYFEPWNHGVLDDPRTHVFVNDGRQHLRMVEDRRFDLITLEPPPIHFAGVSSLYSVEFYELARSRLEEGGFLTQWFPAYQVPPHVSRSMVQAFIEVFPDAILLSGFERHLILLGRRGGAPRIEPEAVARRLERNPRVREDLESIRMGTLTELIGSFAGGPDALARTAREVPPVSDDYPLMEYDSAPLSRSHRVPAELFEVRAVTTWCPECLDEGRDGGLGTRLGGYLEITSGVYAADWFLSAGRRTGGTRGEIQIAGHPGVWEAYRSSPYLQTILPGMGPHLRRVGEQAAQPLPGRD